MILLNLPADLTPQAYDDVVRGGRKVDLSAEALARVADSRALFLRHLETGVVCYGVNTGLGALAGQDLGAAEMAAMPRHVLLARAVASGPAYPASIGRGALLIRLAQFLKGYSAVTPELCRFMAARLNDGLSPVIPSQGHGMAGEIIPLSHVGQVLVGEGLVHGDGGAPIPAADWFRARGLSPYAPQPKEGLALINGVAAASAMAHDVVGALNRTLALATLTAAATLEGLGASQESWGADVARLRPDAGLAQAAAGLRHWLDGSGVQRGDRQPPVSLRVVPQVHGMAQAALDALAKAVVDEWRTVSDNPVFLPDPGSPVFGALVHSGNFHCAELTARTEAMALAIAQVAQLSERRLHRVLDARFTGLSPQLASKPGLDAGLVALHKAALGLGAQVRSLSVPPSLMHGETSFGQEDMMTMALPALDRLTTLDRLTHRMLCYELYTALVALDQRQAQGGGAPGPALATVHRDIRAHIPAYGGDRPFGPEVGRLAGLVDAIVPDAPPPGGPLGQRHAAPAPPDHETLPERGSP
ncbi:MAG: aromatic amino acid lyase [Rhodobacteraceae bacterium]|nr:aromatic amino acid lyase [Paracoccaceae bacterium]